MNILILGGNRFVGKRVLEAVAAKGHRITLLNRGNIPDGVNSPQIRRVKADRFSESQMREALQDSGTFDQVFDFSCYFPSQVEIVRTLLEGRVNRYVVISTQAVYEYGQDLMETDIDPMAFRLKNIPADEKTMDYQTAKRAVEAMFFQKTKFPTVAIRFPFILGPDDYTKRFQWHVDRIQAGLPIHLPAIESRFSMIHSADAADALVKIAGLQMTGPLNLCAHDPIIQRDMIAIIEKKLDKKAALTDQSDDQNFSPYGITGDYVMMTDELNALGIRPREIREWLETLL